MKAALILAQLIFVTHKVHAEWVQAEGSYIFPPSLTETEACANADQRARIGAIITVTGETLSADETQRCTDQGDEAECARNSAIWTSLGGTIVQTRNLVQQTLPEQESFRRCVVRFEADVKAAQGLPDPSFTLGFTLNANVFRDGENMVLHLNPSQPMYVQIFQWLPYEKGEAQVLRLFPNGFDTDGRITQPITIPTTKGSKRYDLKLRLPPPSLTSQKMVDEYLMVVATRTPVTLRDSLSLNDFQRVIAEIPRTDSRIIRCAYNIIRGDE